MKLVSIKTQSYLLLIPYLGLFIVAIIQTINLSKIICLKNAIIVLFKSLFITYFIVGFLYSYFIHPRIYNEDNMNLTYILVIMSTYLIHIIIGAIMLFIQSKEIKQKSLKS